MLGFSPLTLIAGAFLKQHDDYGASAPPVWVLPDPPKKVPHFKSAGRRAQFERGEITHAQATHEVPVYRGADASLVKAIRAGNPPRRRGNVPGRFRRAAKRHHDFLVRAA